MADKVLVIGVDETEHSFYALRWMLQHFFGPNDISHNLVIVHAKPPPSSVLAISGPGIPILPISILVLKSLLFHLALMK